MLLLIGLGNPGKKYANTRHNVGYLIIDELEKENLNGFILAKTKTFMNESGKSVKKLVTSYQLPVTSLLIIHDDIDLPMGEFKIQKGRGAAGHKGVQSIINELKTKDFWRVRVGICPKKGPSTSLGVNKPKNVEKFVLQNFSKKEKKTLQEVVARLRTVLPTLR